ncbi:hypothetical protein MRX96_039893 [Rhipicephalus microplus]
MASLRIAPRGFAVLIVICLIGAARSVLVGGWHRQSVGDNAMFEELAHFAISRQVVAGTNYRIKFKVGESTCRVTETYTKEACVPQSRETVKDTCTAVIYDVPWLNERSVSSFTCEGSSTST